MHQISVAADQHEGFSEGLFQYQSHVISNHHESLHWESQIDMSLASYEKILCAMLWIKYIRNHAYKLKCLNSISFQTQCLAGVL